MATSERILSKNSLARGKDKAKHALTLATLFLGDLRDGLTMLNMQAAYLMVSKHYNEKQVGILFLAFGMSQFLFQTPAGYLYDYTREKVVWLSVAATVTTIITLTTIIFAEEQGKNLWLMVFVKFLQGAVTAFIPPGLNSITQGIVGSTGMTKQVSMNEMMSHFGTALVVLSSSLLALALFPRLHYLFVVGPLACLGALLCLRRIGPKSIDHNAARGLTFEVPDLSLSGRSHSSGSYKAPGESGIIAASGKGGIMMQPSFDLGFGAKPVSPPDGPQAETPLQVLRDPVLLTFILIIFLFHVSNATVLPLVMQTLAFGEGRLGIFLSGLCIVISQLFMVPSAKICGDFSGVYGRKLFFLIGFFALPFRCLLLLLLLLYGESWRYFNALALSTQILDGIAAGIFGTMYVLVTSDISGGTGRFSLTLGLTTAAMSIGGTISGYMGEALAYHLGYFKAFFILMVLSLFPAFLFLFCMPETLRDHVKGDRNKMYEISSIHESHDEYMESEMPTLDESASAHRNQLV